MLYGTAYEGGEVDSGVVFRINLDGSGFTILHSFGGGAGDGAGPCGALTLSGSMLYGTTYYGGAADSGVVFRINLDGSGYTNLHEFVSGAGDGAYPFSGGLTLSGTTLYGATYEGGAADEGAIFQMNIDGSGYTNLHEFAGGAGDGAYPYSVALTLSRATLYGTTYEGGVSNNGVVFALELADPWEAGYQDVGDGWRWFAWFGYYVPLGNHWFWHLDHGYLYAWSASTPQSIYFWTPDMSWLWTGSTTYPYIYRFSDGSWLWYEPGTTGPRWFYNFKTGLWESH
jgi:uncharacterized repeat protein (TIGR03803 family)